MRKLLLLGTIAAVGGCNKRDPGPAADKAAAPAVARVGGKPITLDDLNRRIAEQGAAGRNKASTPAGRREILDGLVRQEALAQEAERRGLQDSPAVREQQRRAMVAELVRLHVDHDVGGASFTDAELRRYFETHREDFQRPERVRAWMLALRASDATRAAQRRKAAALLKTIAAAERAGDARAFESTVQRESEDGPTRPKGGDLGWLTHDELERLEGPEIARAAFTLRAPGEITGPIDTKAGIAVLKLQARLAALDTSFESARETIRSRLLRDRRTRDYEELAAKAVESAKVTIDEAALERAAQGPAVSAGPVKPPPR